ncbi:hypothetical protein HMPREF9466_01379 [Fusobacterium necrophorum subsp. funduliforme 1_1_36S]|nr:hypothetical protein HMPREF9466_01379 [Fusobacterium necrophorum subsp. funduliforme 1_1_36S]
MIYQALVHNDALGIQEKVLEVEKEKLKISFSRFLPVIGLQGFYGEHSLSLLSSSHYLLGILGGVFSIFNGFQDISAYQKAKIEQRKAMLKKKVLFYKVLQKRPMFIKNYKAVLKKKRLRK